MTLSSPVDRKHIHTREINCFGYERKDGLWDIEGQIKDTKTYSFNNEDRGKIQSGTPVHEMLVRLTVDNDLNIYSAEASTESSPFGICPNIASSVANLKGLKITSGWAKSVKDKIGSVKGCTHITQLLIGPLATTAYQTIIPLKNSRQNNKSPATRPAIIDTCYGWSAHGPIVKRTWPKYYEGSE